MRCVLISKISWWKQVIDAKDVFVVKAEEAIVRKYKSVLKKILQLIPMKSLSITLFNVC